MLWKHTKFRRPGKSYKSLNTIQHSYMLPALMQWT